MDNSKNKEVVRGKRYTPEEKSEVVSFVTKYNEENGRGGQSAAATKFGISQLTIATWLKRAGSTSSKKSAGKGGLQKKLTDMLSLGRDIEKLERELSNKKKDFEALKASL